MKKPQAADAMKTRQSFALIHLAWLALAGLLLNGCGEPAQTPARQSAPVERKGQVRSATTEKHTEAAHPNAGAADMASTSAVKMNHVAPAAPANPGAVPGSVAIDGEPVSCAVAPDGALGLADSAAFNLLGVELSQKPGLALLERAEVGKVLKERSLQLALAAGGVGERRALGTLLKARLLVILRAGERTVDGKAVRFVELAACESKYGLRLAQAQLPWDEARPEGFVNGAVAAIALARRRLDEPVRAILAVPPLVSDDLEHRYDALQDAYARLLSESFATVPGVRVVELEEARALGDELKLAGDGSGLERPMLPCYLNGRYRNEGRDAARTVKLTLELKRGGQPAGTRASGALKPEAAGGWLQGAAGELLGQSLAGAPIRFDAGVEAGELAGKARQFEALGEWDKALTLTEAALLLRPEDAELHGLAVRMSTRIINDVPEEPELYGYERYLEQVKHAVAVNLRGVEHFDFYLRRGDFRPLMAEPRQGRALEEQLQAFWHAGQAFLKNYNRLEPDVIDQITELGRTKRAFLLDWQARPAGPSFPFNFTGNQSSDPLNTFVPIKETPQEQCKIYLELVSRLGTMNGEPRANFLEMLRQLTFSGQSDGSKEDFLNQVAALPGSQFSWVVKCYHAMLPVKDESDEQRLARLEKLMLEINGAELGDKAREDLLSAIKPTCSQLDYNLEAKRKREREKAREMAKEAARRKAGATPTPEPHLAPKRPVSADDDYVMTPLPEIKITPEGWIECAGQTDLVWDKGRIWRMRRKGELELLHTVPMGAGELSDIVYDGRRAWAPLKDALLAIDPAAGTVDTIDGKRGLPPGELKVAPLGDGRLCAVGGFGRAWCAVLDYQDEGKPVKVDIFHEARLSTGAWDDPALAFTPTFVATFKGEGGKPLVLVGRGRPDRASYLALLLDPARRTARTVPGRISNRLRGPQITRGEDGALYWIASSWDITDFSLNSDGSYNYDAMNGPCLRLARFGAPECRETAFFGLFPTTMFYSMTQQADTAVPLTVFTGGECFALLDECWLVDGARGRAVRLKGTMPQYRMGKRRPGRSHHYGTVVIAPEYGTEWSCYAFKPREGLTARLAELKPKEERYLPTVTATLPEHHVQQRDPMDGRLAVVRLYRPDKEGAIDRYTTFTAPIIGRRLIVEREQSDLMSSLVMVGDEQRDPELKGLMKGGACYLGRPHYAVQSGSANSGENPYCYPISLRTGTGNNFEPWEVAVSDAEGQPVAGATVEFTYQITDQWWMQSFGPSLLGEPPGGRGRNPLDMTRYNAASLRVRNGKATTDAAGHAPTPQFQGMDLSQIAFTVSHPDYGRAVCRVPIERMSRVMGWMGQSRPAGKRESDFSIRLPLAKRGSAAAKKALCGRVVDGQGRPVEGATITAIPGVAQYLLNPMAVMIGANASGAVLSDAAGRFRIIPMIQAPRGSRDLPDGTEPCLAVISKGSVDVQETVVILTPGEEKTVRIEGDGQPCRIRILDATGREVDPSTLKAKLVRGNALKFTGAGRQDKVIFDGSAGQRWPGEMKLAPGIYQFQAGPEWQIEPVFLKPGGERELTFRATDRPQLAMPAGQGATAPMAASQGNSSVTAARTGNTPQAGGKAAATVGTPMPGRVTYVPAKPKLLTLSYEGRVVDALTSQPLAGALILTEGGLDLANERILKLTANDLAGMRGPAGMLDVDRDPALGLLREIKYDGLATRTDEAGRFKLEVKPWKDYYRLMVVAGDHLPITHAVYEATHEGTRAVMPVIRLHPAGMLMLQVDVTPTQKAGEEVYLRYAFADPAKGDWDRVFKHTSNTIDTNSQNRIKRGEPGQVRVPAGVKFTMTMRAQPQPFSDYAYWPDVPVGRVVEVKQGETLDLGKFEIRRQDKPIVEPNRPPRTMTMANPGEVIRRGQFTPGTVGPPAPNTTPEPPLPKVNVPEKPTWEEANGLWLKSKWAACREAMTRFAAQNAGSPRAWEARGKSVICLFHLKRYESFGSEAAAFLKDCPAAEAKIRLEMEVKTRVEAPGLRSDWAGVLAGARELLPRLQPGSKDWATTLIWRGNALSRQSPPDTAGAIQAFDTVLKTGVQDAGSRASQLTNAALWRGMIALQQSDRAKATEMLELIKGLPDNKLKNPALKMLSPKP